MSKLIDPRHEARAALTQAQKAAKRGDHAGAERWTKTADRLTESARRFAELPTQEEGNVDELRAELRRRLQLFVEADVAIQEFERMHGFNPLEFSGELPGAPYTQADLRDIAMGREVERRS